jgi:DNA-binding transcriptional ArsR family regulator
MCCTPDSSQSQQLLAQSALLKLAAEPSRLQLLCIIRQGEHSVSQMMAHVQLSQSLISHHLRDLREAELVVDEKQGREVRYRLTPKGEQLMEVLSLLTSKKESV